MMLPVRSLFSAVFGATPKLADDIRQAIDRTVDVVDPQIRMIGGFDRKLAPAVESALGHVDRMIDELPGPMSISRHAFSADPLVHAVFATAQDIENMLGTSQAVRDYLHETESYGIDAFYALFAARRLEKRQFGLAVQGEVIRSDVPQTVLYFSDQTLTEPAADLAPLRVHLRRVFFDSLLKSFSTHLSALREERENLRAGLSVERAHLTVLRGRTGGPEYAVHTRRVAELDDHLRKVGADLAPAAVVEALAIYLARPDTAMRLEPCSVRVDRLGIVSSPEAGPASSDVATLRFPEMVGRDRRRYMVMLARIDVAEAREAVEHASEAQRRFVIL